MAASPLELFAFDSVVSALDQTLTQSRERSIDKLLALAWHLRQRDCQRARVLVEEIESALPTAGLDPREKARVTARANLIEAEFHSLTTEFEAAKALANSAIIGFKNMNDHIGAGDAYWLLASISTDSGDAVGEVENLEFALENYRLAGHSNRAEVVIARMLANASFSDAKATEKQLAEQTWTLESPSHPEAVWIFVARANVAGLTDDPLNAIKHDLKAHHVGMASGQKRQALVCAVNATESFTNLGDFDAALEWSEKALGIAKGTNWPASIGVCLTQAGDVMRLLGRYNEARTYLHEALAQMTGLSRARNHEMLLATLGQLELDAKNNAQALDWYSQVQYREGNSDEAELILRLHRGQATALSRLGKGAEALKLIERALALARETGHAYEQIRALRIYAELHRDHQLPTPNEMSSGATQLYYLNQAVAITKTIEGSTPPAGLLNQLAHAHASYGDYAKAFEYLVAANTAGDRMRQEKLQNRALSMRVRQEIDRAEADIQHHRELAERLQDTNSTLEILGTIGRNITASLDAEEVCNAINQHVHALLDATSFWIFLLDEQGQVLNSVFGGERQVEVSVPYSFPLDHPSSLSARCARERAEIVIDDLSPSIETVTIPGTEPSRSLLFSPLEVGNRLLGVMTIQSLQANAYRERERSIFRTLCAYGAIALDNAASYSKVEHARAVTAAQEQELRIAAVAFESHEGLLITNADRLILRANLAFTKITGYPASELIGNLPAIFRSARTKPEDYDRMNHLVATTGVWQGEIYIRRKDGGSIPLSVTITSVKDTNGTVTNLVYSIVDITDRKIAEEEIRNLAFYDALTNLPNRRLLLDRLRQAMATSSRSEQFGALIFIDLDNFKNLNDTRGHDVGDLLLKEVAARLLGSLREGDTAARLGGDEFVVLLCELGNEVVSAAERAGSVAEKILAALNRPYLLGDHQHHSTPSIGICLFLGQEEPVDVLLRQADVAMYQSKAAGRNTIRFFDSAMQTAVTAHAVLEADLRRALDSHQFTLAYQPQVNANGVVTGAEALVRWNHPEKGTVLCNDFIFLAEETGLILRLGEWVLDAACRQLHDWSRDQVTAQLTMAVNISALQFHSPTFVAEVTETLKRTHADPTKLKLELTESLLLRDVDAVIDKMKNLIALGVRFSLDDFGTGYSSLSYLKRLPIEQLKIDQSFVRDIFLDSDDLAIVRAIVTLGRSLGLQVIAEGVETEEQRKFLESSGCDAYQGYLFGRPGPADAVITRH
jgi:diguanylate cyclase (GGDEF)-like protein/PAS domain S-box-containing protein